METINKIMNLNLEFWNNKKILITGHTGFKGAWLASFLYKQNCELFGISKDKKEGIYKLASVSKLMQKEYIFDINVYDQEEIDGIFSSINPDIVFHFAAQSIVSESYKNPFNTLETNAMGTYKILNASNKTQSVKTLIIATTDKVYKVPSKLNVEKDELGGTDYYSISKVMAEIIIKSFIEIEKRKDLNISIARSGNVVGGGDRGVNRLITDLVESCISNKEFVSRNPKSIRPWQYILDSIYGYVLLAQYSEELKVSEVFNLNSKINNKYESLQVAELFLAFWGNKNKVLIKNEKNFDEVETLKLNSSKAEEKMNWAASFDVGEAIRETVNWEKHYINSNDIEYTLNHVEDYILKLKK